MKKAIVSLDDYYYRKLYNDNLPDSIYINERHLSEMSDILSVSYSHPLRIFGMLVRKTARKGMVTTVKNAEAIRRLSYRITDLERQVSCGMRGHKVTLKDKEDDGKVVTYVFECIYCKASYARYEKDLSEREALIVKGIDN